MNNKILIIILLIILIIFYYKLELFLINYNIKNKNIINLNQTHGHLGDNIFNFYYFNNIKNYIEKNNIIINYYVKKEYHDQLKEFNTSKNIIIHDYKDIGLNVHICNIIFNNNFYINYLYSNLLNNSKINYDIFYLKFFNELSKKLKIPYFMNEFIYKNNNLLIEYEKLNDKYKNIDILIINSMPLSTQFDFNINDWNKFIYKLHDNKFKIVTTLKVKNINCTLDDNLKLFKIGAISTHAKIIIAINTGPTSTIFNEYTLNYTKKIYLFDNRVTFTMPIITHLDNINQINIEELKNIILLKT